MAQPVIERIELTRHESGCGYSMAVWHTMRVFYTNREPFVLNRLSTYGLDRHLESGNVPREIVSSVARNGGVIEKTETGWRLAH